MMEYIVNSQWLSNHLGVARDKRVPLSAISLRVPKWQLDNFVAQGFIKPCARKESVSSDKPVEIEAHEVASQPVETKTSLHGLA